MIRAESIHSVDEQIEIFWCFFFQLLISAQMEGESTKKHQFSLNGCFGFFANVRQLTVQCFNGRLGKTASLQPVGTSLRKTPSGVKFVDM